ncbi:hypothetical protein SacmaDRAFT_0192 [Saccharomonospora marina XMU15]|uniref:DUF4396 domain-containing protein n=1 Tax=Saccharomonospora marina XMU15 TaxID=882083 RepID=H5WZA1_9PSEU|nr:hypothetical protein SacmaDRAFT_0192 [Saccharomonospora marina XMU15]
MSNVHQHATASNEEHGSHAGHDQHSADADHADHADHAHHGSHGHHGSHPATWGVAASATLHCLTGCAVGEILGMVIGTALGWNAAATIVLAVALAFFFGYAFSMRGVLRAGVGFKQALKVALAADTVSIAVMEIVDNGVMVAVPGAMEAGLGTVLFWGALAFAFLVAFLITMPVNKWLIGRGRGHAVAHAYHH